MCGNESNRQPAFSYVSLEERVPADHPLRAIRRVVEEILAGMSKRFDSLYAEAGRPSIPPEQPAVPLVRGPGEWNHAVFSKNRERLLNEEVAPC